MKTGAFVVLVWCVCFNCVSMSVLIVCEMDCWFCESVGLNCLNMCENENECDCCLNMGVKLA